MTEKPVTCRSCIRNSGIFLGITGINTLLAMAGILSFQVGPGISALYIAVAFEIAFALWFGMYGAIAAYCGAVLSGFLTTVISLPLDLVWSLANLWQVLIPLLAFHLLKADVSLNSSRDIGIFLAFGLILNNLIGAIWGTGILALAGSISEGTIPASLAAWFFGNVIVTLGITPILLRYGTPVLQRKKLLVKGIRF